MGTWTEKLNPSLRASLTIALIGSVFLGGAYFFFVREKTSYFTERNLRHLASIGRQLESSVRSNERILKTLTEAGSEEIIQAALEAKILEVEIQDAKAAQAVIGDRGVPENTGCDEARQKIQALEEKLDDAQEKKSREDYEQALAEDEEGGEGQAESPPSTEPPAVGEETSPKSVESIRKALLGALQEAEEACQAPAPADETESADGGEADQGLPPDLDPERLDRALQARWQKLVPLFAKVSALHCTAQDLFPKGPWQGLPLAAGEVVSLLGEDALYTLVGGKPLLGKSGDGPSLWPDVQVCGELPLDALLEPIFRHDIFDTIVLARSGGEVVSQGESAQLILTHLDHLPQRGKKKDDAPRPFAELARTTQVLEVEISGESYKLFLQPLRLTSLVSVAPGDDPGHEGFVVAGLVQSDRFRYESLAVSSTLMAAIAGLFLLVAFSYPFLKIALLGRRQRVRLLDVLLLGVSALLGLALLTLFVLDGFHYGLLKAHSGQQLVSLALEIDHHIGEEVAKAYSQLRRLEPRAVKVHQTLESGGSSYGRCRPSTRVCPELLDDPILFPERRPENQPYPILRDLTLIDEQGHQLLKWSVARAVTPRVAVGQRAYFRQALTDGWPAKSLITNDGDEERGEGKVGEPFYLQSVISWTDGSRRAILAKRVEPSAAAAEAAGDISLSAPRVITASLPMLSLIDPLLPPGFGFAIVDARGNVLFHSDTPRNLNENLITESGGDRDLRSALFARRAAHLVLRYGESSRRAYVKPLTALPAAELSVMAFYDKEALRIANIEALFVAALLFLLYTSIYVAAALGLLLFRPSYRAPWLWPQNARIPIYLDLAAVFFVIALTHAVSFLWLEAIRLLIVSAAIPVVILTVTFLVLRRPENPLIRRLAQASAAAAGLIAAGAIAFLPGDLGVEPPLLAFGFGIVFLALLGLTARAAVWTTRHLLERVPLELAYETLGALLLLSLAVLPVGGFFRVGYTIHMESLIKYDQLRIARALDARWQSIDAFYRGITVPEAQDTGPAGDDEPAGGVTALRDLRARLEQLDIYTEILYDTRLKALERSETTLCSEPRYKPLWGRRPFYRLLEATLPQYDSRSADMRGLLYDRSSDPQASYQASAWRFRREKGRLRLELCDYGDEQILQVDTALPRFYPRPLPEAPYGGASLGAVTFFGFAGMVGLGALFFLGLTTSFLGRNIFLIDLKQPLSAAARRKKAGEGGGDTTRDTAGGNGDRPPATLAELLVRECSAHACLEKVRDELAPVLAGEEGETITAEQLLEEIGERAESDYQQLWESSSDEEKLALVHLGEEGLLNAKNRRAIRCLLGRRLIRRDPEPRLLNESFRLFVLSDACREEVAKLETTESAWDRLRGPLSLLLVAIVVFVALTQQEFLDSTIALLSGIIAAIPVIFRFFGFLRPAPPGRPPDSEE